MAPNPETIPEGFQPLPKGHHCPSCHSKLIKKMPTEVTCIEQQQQQQQEQTDDTAPEFDTAILQSSLESARCANLLLQAMSFDAATREDGPKPVDDGPDPVSGVGYCASCKVHVITDPSELSVLFDKVPNDDELRGRMYVCVSEEDVASLAHRKEMGEPACSYDIVTPAGSDLPGVTAVDFPYEYRHGVAVKAMGRKIARGYGLTEELCELCEMPLMMPPPSSSADIKNECVVCPELDRTKSKYTTAEGLPKFTLETNPTEDSLFEIDEEDPISLIIAEARRAIKNKNEDDPHSCRSPGAKVQEAKSYLISKNKAAGDEGSNSSKAATAELTPDPSKADVASAQITTPADVSAVDWENLFRQGRVLFSQRIQQGWTVGTSNCTGKYCKHTPLLVQDDTPVCTVCGGSGNGLDGAYRNQVSSTAAGTSWEDLVSNGRAILTERLKHGWTLSEENCTGVHCQGIPLTRDEEGALSCVVCGGNGSGVDGMYAAVKSEEVLEAERALATQEIAYLMSMGWTLRDSLCEKCQIPLVAEELDSEDVCILCETSPLNQLLGGGANVGPVMDSACFDENANEAAQRIKLGWRLGDSAPLCNTCGGVQMTPPDSMECGCINRACPMVLPEALVSDPALLPTMPDSQPVNQRTGSEVLKKVTDKLSIGRLLKDGLVPLMVCGAPDYTDDQSAMTDDMSMIRSTTSNALGAIMARLDQAKYQLQMLNAQGQYGTEEMVMKQGEIAMLIEKLSNAAVAMKEIEQIEARDPPMCL